MVVQCSDVSMLDLGKIYDLSDQGKYKFMPIDSEIVNSLLATKQKLVDKIRNEIDSRLNEISHNHYYNVINTI